VKILRPQWQADPRAVALLRREARVGHQVSHPHLIAVLATGFQRPPYYLVTPWLNGRSLRELLAEPIGLDLPFALWTIRQVAEALDALHTANWMHGDVKPGNILVSPGGHATLLDLGFARRTGETGSVVDRPLTGTGHYLAPETLTSTLRADVRSDIYSLGVVLFEATARRLPFQGDSLGEVLSQHLRARPPDLRRIAPHLPTGVVRLVGEMLAKEPLRRPQTPRELIERLTALEIATFGERLLGGTVGAARNAQA
jgi:serine/threonine-protein kinase